jgi:hypothetical protein
MDAYSVLCVRPRGAEAVKEGFIAGNYRYRDRLCGLVVRVPSCRYRGPGYDSRCYQIFYVAVGLEWSPLSLMRISEELFERKSDGSGLGN